MIDPQKYGVSVSVKQCRNFGVNTNNVLDWLIGQGFRRFRLMSYWDEMETHPGTYDFAELDQQLKQISQAGGVVTLCLGVRQPRWPESHWPEWAWTLPKPERDQTLLRYLEAVVKRYTRQSCIISWQLENEAHNRSFGERGDFDRQRLRAEFDLVKRLDPKRPVIMTTSNSWGLPFRQPMPDIIGFSFYATMNLNGKQTTSALPVWSYRLRAILAKIFLRRPSFIHELQAEPWGPKNIWDMTIEEQDQSMDIERLKQNIRLGQAANIYPIDLWGAEWWYWRLKQGDACPWQIIKNEIL